MKLRLLAAAAIVGAIAAPALAQPPEGAGQGEGGTRRDPAAAFAAMDTNKDGGISKEEWTAGGRPEAAFDRLDANHDGKITQDEMAAARARRGAGGGGEGGGGRGGPPPGGEQ
jgi:hypothetical protein